MKLLQTSCSCFCLLHLNYNCRNPSIYCPHRVPIAATVGILSLFRPTKSYPPSTTLLQIKTPPPPLPCECQLMSMEIQRSTASWKLASVRAHNQCWQSWWSYKRRLPCSWRGGPRGQKCSDTSWLLWLGMGWGVVVSYLMNWVTMHGGMNHVFDSKDSSGGRAHFWPTKAYRKPSNLGSHN